MKTSVNLWTVLLLLLLLCVAACHRSETDVEKGTHLQILHKGNGQEVQDLDPQLVNSVSSLNIISVLLEGLVSEDPHDLHPVPGVAESWKISSDEKNYTFHLRHNAKWSNGEPVVAQNFIDSYHQMWRQNLNVNATPLNQEKKVYSDSRRQMNYQIYRSTGSAIMSIQIRFSTFG